jgi:hypothetical protein
LLNLNFSSRSADLASNVKWHFLEFAGAHLPMAVPAGVLFRAAKVFERFTCGVPQFAVGIARPYHKSQRRIPSKIREITFTLNQTLKNHWDVSLQLSKMCDESELEQWAHHDGSKSSECNKDILRNGNFLSGKMPSEPSRSRVCPDNRP